MMPLNAATHAGKSSADQHGTIDMNANSFNVKTPTPLGTLSVFPREIRDEIYRYFFSQKRFMAISAHSYIRPKLTLGPRLSLSILCLSKIVREEAVIAMYSGATFWFPIDYSCSCHHLQHLDTRSMMKIEMFYDATFDDEESLDDRDNECDTSRPHGPARECPLHLFAGDTVARNSILIMLEVSQFWEHAADLTRSNLFATVKQLTGFKTVTLRLAINEAVYYNEPRRMVYDDLKPVLRIFAKSLEPTLGKRIVSRELPADQTDLNKLVPWAIELFEVVFHPGDHQAAVSKMKRSQV